MIDADGKEQLFLRNPADTKGGFWLTYFVDGVLYVVSSTEKETISIDSKESGKGRVRIVLNHKPVGCASPIARFDIEVWSHNAPVMLIRHRVTNLGDKVIEDMKLYNLMDFDVGGPSSYKDDKGIYEEDSGLISVCDDNPLCVAMASKPVPDAWEIGSPIKLKVSSENRDLKKNLELGPKDIATGLQWNHGDLEPNESKTVDIVLSCATNLSEAKALIMNSWELFKKKIQ
ncbi:MAG: hypothetical protein E4H14_09790 [Candidatus Thorarchaeota archaeon]|nr:MAG: hypothetical protein E4H14_09790 [Candidatus Thorarchaeota archaeon]